MTSLDAPTRTCPGQPRLEAFRAALNVLANAPAPQLERFTYPVLSLGHTRDDAWQTSLATARLNTLRKAAPLGTVVGGFGWLRNVRPATRLPAFTAEFIHAPSHDQAAAAAVLRSAAMRANSADSSHADIDLSSRRVRLAHWLVDGVRNGRTLKELLGARFERRLTQAGGGALLPRLRHDYPGGLSSGILDGLALRAAPPPITDDAFTTALADLDGSFDALADALTAEAVYQLVRGNPAGALVELDDIVRGERPPRLEVTESPKLGTRLTHRVAAVMPAGQRAPGWPAAHTPRGDADPILDAWCGQVIGSAASTIVTIDGTISGAAVAVRVGLDRLGIGAVDVVAATSDSAAELTQRLLARGRAARPGLVDAAVRPDPAFKDLVRLGTRMARLIARAEPLTAGALTVPGTPSATGGGEGDLPARVAAAQARLERLRDTLAGAGAPATLRNEAAGFGIVLPGARFDGALGVDERDALASAVRGRLAAAAARAEPRDRLRALVGNGVLGLVAVTAPDAAVLATAATPPQNTFTGVDIAACAAWLEAMARVRPALAPLADVIAMAEISDRAPAPPLRIAQAPWVPGDPWIAVQWTNPSLKAPAQGRLSLLLHAPAGLVPTQQLGGFVVDAWADAVPPPKRDTSLAVRNNGPNTQGAADGAPSGRAGHHRGHLEHRHAGVVLHGHPRRLGVAAGIPEVVPTSHPPRAPHRRRGHLLRGREARAMSDYQQWIQLVPVGFDTSLVTELEARVFDPMWLLVRQLQFGEFDHDGGSSPVDIAVTLATAQPSRMRAATAAGDETPVEIRLGRSPLEALVEQEPIPIEGLDELRLRAESGMYLQRLLRAAGLAAQADAWAARCPFTVPAGAVLDEETRDWYDTMAGRVPDRRTLGNAVGRVITGQDPSIVLAPGELDVLIAWRDGPGFGTHAARGPGNWDPEQLEYRLSAATVVGAGEVVLDVPEYVEGTLDWHAFDVGNVSLGLTGTTGAARIHRLPVPLQFAGMPNNRFWSLRGPRPQLRPARPVRPNRPQTVDGDDDGAGVRPQLRRRLVPGAHPATGPQHLRRPVSGDHRLLR